jgi:hypothetical protein
MAVIVALAGDTMLGRGVAERLEVDPHAQPPRDPLGHLVARRRAGLVARTPDATNQRSRGDARPARYAALPIDCLKRKARSGSYLCWIDASRA